MNEILRFWGLVALVVLVGTLLTIFLVKKFNKRGIYKYIPTIVIWLMSLSFLLFSIFFAEPMQDLGYLVMSMIAGMAALITLIITIIIDVINKKKKN